MQVADVVEVVAFKVGICRRGHRNRIGSEVVDLKMQIHRASLIIDVHKRQREASPDGYSLQHVVGPEECRSDRVGISIVKGDRRADRNRGISGVANRQSQTDGVIDAVLTGAEVDVGHRIQDGDLIIGCRVDNGAIVGQTRGLTHEHIKRIVDGSADGKAQFLPLLLSRNAEIVAHIQHKIAALVPDATCRHPSTEQWLIGFDAVVALANDIGLPVVVDVDDDRGFHP